MKDLVKTENITKTDKCFEIRLQRRILHESLISKISLMAIWFKDKPGFLQECVTILGEGLKVSRCYVFEYIPDKHIYNNINEWCAPGISQEIDNLQNIPSDSTMWWTDTLSVGNDIAVANIEDIPDKNVVEILKAQGIISIHVYPLFIMGNFAGFIGFDDCVKIREWPEEDRDVLFSISRVISLALERKLAEEELNKAIASAKESDRLKSAFLANISHEIRTPVNSIVGFVELLVNYDNNQEEKEMYAKLIKDGSNRLMNTIRDILEVSKIQSREVEINISNCNIFKLVNDTYEMFTDDAKLKNIKYVLENEIYDGTTLNTDCAKLEFIIINYINNALKFTSQGEIVVSASIVDKKFLFSVKDTGKGIPEDKLLVIFDQFISVEEGYTRSAEGLGLGLTIAKSYATLLGGELKAESIPGEGSTFYLKIPV